MSIYATELATLQQRLVTDPGHRDIVLRRIGDVEAAMKAEAAAGPPAAPEAELADHGNVETAMLPAPKSKRGR